MRWRRWILWLLGGLVAFTVTTVGILSSGWFAERVRLAIIERTETASGGRAELQSFHFDWSSMRATVRGFTLHGLEQRDQPPFFSASEITLDLRVVSFLQRDVVLRRLVVERPSIHIYVGPDGKTNLPSPAHPDPKSDPVANLLRTRIRRIEVTDGVFEYDRRSIPFHLTADHFGAALDYQAKGPAYAAAISSSHLRLNGLGGVGFDARLRLETGRIGIEHCTIRRLGAEALVSGELAGFRHPSLKVSAKVSQPLKELGMDGLRSGLAHWDAEVNWDESGYSARGPVIANGIEWRSEDFRLSNGSFRADASLIDGVISLEDAKATGLGGTWTGRAEFRRWSFLKLDGVVSSVSLAAIASAVPGTKLPWDGSISGPISFSGELGPWGVRKAEASGRLEIRPAEARLPAEGALNVAWRQADGRVTLDDSVIRLPASEVRLSGTLGQSLNAALSTHDLAEIETAAGLFFEDGLPLTQYVELNGGAANVDAVIDGPLGAPAISGRVGMTRFKAGGVDFDSGSATFRVDARRLDVRRFDISHAGARSAGQVSLPLADWTIDSAAPMRASVNLRNVGASDIARIAGIAAPLGGRITASASVAGSLDLPSGVVDLDWRDAAFGPERVQRISASLRTTVDPMLDLAGEVTLDGDMVKLAATYNHSHGDWRNGQLRLQLGAAKVNLARLESFKALRPGLGGNLEARLSSGIAVKDGTLQLTSLDGFVQSSVQSGTRALGAMRVDASTARQIVQLRVQGNIEGHEFGGEARIRPEQGYTSDGRFALPRIPLRDLQSALGEPDGEPWPVQGFVGGDITFKGNLANPHSLTARVAVTRLHVAPREGGILEADVEKNDLVIRNAAPITIDIDATAAYLRPARLSARDTSLTAAGLYTFASSAPLDLSLNGTVNLEVLSTFEPDLLAAGTAQISANMRGRLASPSINGQMRISGASFFLRNLANGIDNASGLIRFDRDRAQIDNLTGQSGGGKFKINGFVGFGAHEWTYRLAAEAEAIRVRYPEGVSTTADASLTLTGSSTRSLLSGLLTIRRSGFNMKQDLGSIIAGSTNPIPVPATQNAFLRNLQFDIRVRTSPNATFQTSYTRDLETRADLRLRGSPAKPVILGSVEVNQGEVQFFGNQYNISRGELLFFNTAAIQPSINLDLETRIRGVTVYINVSGPLSRLDVNYRSEPPLQSQEILALLTVGRAPTATSSTIPASISSRSSVLGESNANTLLGGALSASVSSRVQKFFGASRIKIDPNVTGVENLPQARLTIEQSLSRNIVFTYSINLSRSSQQVVRMEWDLSNDWSLIAVRDENGAFGVDFLYRHRFK